MKFYSIPSPRVRRTDWKRIVLVAVLAVSTAASLSSPFRRQQKLASNYHVPVGQGNAVTTTKRFVVGADARASTGWSNVGSPQPVATINPTVPASQLANPLIESPRRDLPKP